MRKLSFLCSISQLKLNVLYPLSSFFEIWSLLRWNSNLIWEADKYLSYCSFNICLLFAFIQIEFDHLQLCLIYSLLTIVPINMRDRLKTTNMKFDRYKFIVQCIIRDNKTQGVKYGCRKSFFLYLNLFM